MATTCVRLASANSVTGWVRSWLMRHEAMSGVRDIRTDGLIRSDDYQEFLLDVFDTHVSTCASSACEGTFEGLGDKLILSVAADG